jgi:predicted secreted hydrolase
MKNFARLFSTHFVLLLFLSIAVPACAAQQTSDAVPPTPLNANLNAEIPAGFLLADGTRPLSFPSDFGAHPDFHTEWWYYTGNLQGVDGRAFGFELTIFRVGLLPPTASLPGDSQWYNHSLYFAHFAVSDIANQRFYAFERYSRPGPGLAGAQAQPYRIWLEDWSISGETPAQVHLQAAQGQIAIDLNLTDAMGVVLHGEKGYSRKGKSAGNASYYYSQPRLQADGVVQVDGNRYAVSGLVWNDHEFSTSVLDKSQIGWDWFSLQFEDGTALMLFQLRENGGGISDSSSGTFIDAAGIPHALQKSGFEIKVLSEWRSPHTGGIYPAAWQIQLNSPACLLDVSPLMADQEINFPAVTYWEGAVRFEGTCNGLPASGKGYIELTGYAGKLPLP